HENGRGRWLPTAAQRRSRLQLGCPTSYLRPGAPALGLRGRKSCCTRRIRETKPGATPRGRQEESRCPVHGSRTRAPSGLRVHSDSQMVDALLCRLPGRVCLDCVEETRAASFFLMEWGRRAREVERTLAKGS
ncbi:Hypothetical predicted protein, partial [Marmota monax]